MSIREWVPLIALCDSASRLRIRIAECGDCDPKAVALHLSKQGCKRHEEVCEEVAVNSRGCGTPNMPTCTQLVMREVAQPALIYPLHEVDADGFAVFVLDGKLKTLGHGRYRAEVRLEDIKPYIFDVEYVAATAPLGDIIVDTDRQGSHR